MNEKLLVSRLNEAIANSRKSLFYKEHFKNMKNIKDIKDFENYPFTTADDLINQEYKFLCASQSKIEKIITIKSSASSGIQKRFFLTEDDIKSTVDFFVLGLSSIVKEGEKTLLMMPYQLKNGVGDLIIRACNNLANQVFALNRLESFEEAFAILKKVEVVIGSPIEVLALARYVKHIKKTKINLRGVLLSADYASKKTYEEIAETFSCHTINHYGSSEMGYAGAVECLYQDGMHLRENDLYFEILDGEKNATDGNFGEHCF